LFVSRNLPIPDLVASRKNTLLIIEIDARFALACSSIERYKAAAGEILVAARASGSCPDVEVLQLGFGYTGIVSGDEHLRAKIGADASRNMWWFAFEAPRKVISLMPS
jgi:hypothetical protein